MKKEFISFEDCVIEPEIITEERSKSKYGFLHFFLDKFKKIFFLFLFLWFLIAISFVFLGILLTTSFYGFLFGLIFIFLGLLLFIFFIRLLRFFVKFRRML